VLSGCGGEDQLPVFVNPDVGASDGATQEVGTDAAVPNDTAEVAADVAKVCAPGSLTCSQKTVKATCKPDGSGWVDEPCAISQVCLFGKCIGNVCTPGATFCDGAKVQVCNADGSAATTVLDCATVQQTCEAGKCAPAGCVAGTKSCQGSKVVTCKADGSGFTIADCPPAHTCEAGACQPQVCEPSKATCAGSVVQECNAAGTALAAKQDCAPLGKFCNQGACADKACTAGDKACKDGQPAACKADGSGWDKTPCNDDNLCTVDTCDDKTVACVYPPKNCDDDNPCTSDGCAKTSGACTHAQLPGTCDDGSACTKGDQCVAGKCAADPWGALATLAGSGQYGSGDGAAQKADFADPSGVVVGPNGMAYVADFSGHRIRHVAQDGTVTTWVGSGKTGGDDGAGNKAKFDNPLGVALDKQGSLYVTEYGGHRLRKVAADGTVSTLAGDGVAGLVDGPAGKARFQQPAGVAVDAAGVVFVADSGNHRIRKLQAGVVSTVAGLDKPGSKDGLAATALLEGPYGLTIDPIGALWFSERSTHRLRRVGPEGSVSTVVAGGFGFADGPGKTAKLASPHGVAWTPQGGGGVIVADKDNARLRLVRLDGAVSTLVGTGQTGSSDGSAKTATLNGPQAVTVEATGAVVIADTGNQRIRRLALNETVCWDGKPCTADACDAKTAACTFTALQGGAKCDDGNPCTQNETCQAGGQCLGQNLPCDDGNACTLDACATASGACLHSELQGACDDGTACTNGEACYDGQCTVDPNGTVSTLAGSGVGGSQDGVAAVASFNSPRDVAWGPDGSLYVADTVNHKIRRVHPDGKVVTWAGSGVSGGADGQSAYAQFAEPAGITVDKQGTAYVVERLGHRVRRIKDGTVSTVAGDGFAGFQDGSGTGARFNGPTDIVLDGPGVLYVADSFNHRVRKVLVTGVTTTVAGTTKGWKDGPAKESQFSNPSGVCVGAGGALLVADTGNHRIRHIAKDGKVTTLAGMYAGFQDGAGAVAKFNLPLDVAWSANGFAVVADKDNHRLRGVKPDGSVWTLAGTGQYAWQDGPANTARFNAPQGVTLDGQGAIAVADTGNNRVRKLQLTAVACNDFDACTADACDPVSGKCAFTPVPGSCAN
jgi:sugar lactone lactonase YvrE